MARRGAQSRAMFEDFRPVSEWRYGNEAHLLLIQLPGFAKEQIKVSTEGIDTLRIRGERQTWGSKWSRFEEDFRIPDDCNIRGIRAKLENGTLTVTMPTKGPATATQASPKKEETQKAPLGAPLKGPDNEKRSAAIGQETKENVITKVPEKVKEPKKDEDVIEDNFRKENEVDGGKVSFKPKNYFEKIEKKAEEKSKEVKEKEIEKSEKDMESLDIAKKTMEEGKGDEKGKGSLRPEIYFLEEKSKDVKEKEIEKSGKDTERLNIGKETTGEREGDGKGKGSFRPETYSLHEKVGEKSGEGKEKKKEKYKEVAEGLHTANKTKAERMGKGSLKPESYIEKNAKEVILEEERQLMVNMGVAVLVIVALGTYIYYGSYGKAKI